MRHTGVLCKWQRKVQAVRLLHKHHNTFLQLPVTKSQQLRCATTSSPVLLASHKARRTKAKALQDTLGLRVRRILSTNESSSSKQHPHVTRPTTPSPFTPCSAQSQQANDTQSTGQMYGLSPQELEQGIRRSLLRIVLSTDEALQPDAILHDMRINLEPTVQDKCAWVNYCIAQYIQHKQEQHGVEKSEPREANDVEASVRRMCSVGKTYCMLYRRGIIQLINMENKKTEAKAARRQRLCVVTDVLAWMTYTILLCDPHFRISYYGQSVCYPCLPSLLLATYNVPHDGELYTRYAQLVQSLLLPNIEMTDSTSSESGRWTVLHSMFYLFDGFVESSLSHLVVDPLRVRQLMSQSSQTTTTTSSLSALQQHWLRCWGNPKSVSLFSDNTTSATRKDDSNEEAHLTGFNEAKVGGVSLRKLVEELTSGSATSLTQTLARRRAAGNTLYLIQARIIRPLFSYIVCSPIALTRLAMLLRWHVSLPIASAFPSLLYFLLVFAGNPTVRRMYERDRERRQSRVRLGNFFAGLAHPNLSRRQRQVALKATPVYRSQLLSSDTPTATSNVIESNTTSGDVAEEEETRRLRAAFAAHTTTTTTPAGSVEITRLIFFRILPSHRRPSSHSEGASTTTTITYTSIEVLDTDHCTPKEIIAYLQRTVAKEKSQTTIDDSAADWLRAEEEYILCYAVSRVVLTQRLHIVARAWQSQQESNKEEEGGSESEGTTLTVGQLCRLCLWEHEYGPVIASEMMWAYLSLFPDLVQLGPASGPFALRRVTFLRGV